jgi:predicted permease
MCQIACALIVLTGAGLLTRTVLRMQAYDPGIETRHLLTAELDMPEVMGDGGDNLVLAHRLLDALRALPGVTSAAIGNGAGLSAEDPLTVQSKHSGDRSAAFGSTDRIVQITAGYFEALDVPIVQGRMLTPEEFRADSRVALVNEEAARRWWPGEADIVGGRIKWGNGPWATVVGVARNTRPLSTTSVASNPASRVFIPLAKTGSSMLLYARTVGEPLSVLPALHGRALGIDRRVRILMPVNARAQLDFEVIHHRDTATFVGGLAAFGLLLAAMGVYGVTSYAVARRLREIGIRKALGASTGHVVATVSRETAALAVSGIAIGLAASAALTRLLDGMLYGTNPLDISVFAGASLLILGIVALATWVPMRTALRVDPMTTLRCE